VQVSSGVSDDERVVGITALQLYTMSRLPEAPKAGQQTSAAAGKMFRSLLLFRIIVIELYANVPPL
jgi:hypothetical protein